jgi:hypothetical protein
VGLLLTVRLKDWPPAPPGKDADPQESLWDFKGRGRSMAADLFAASRANSDRRFQVQRCEKAH